jgi:hypothetical protein
MKKAVICLAITMIYMLALPAMCMAEKFLLKGKITGMAGLHSIKIQVDTLQEAVISHRAVSKNRQKSYDVWVRVEDRDWLEEGMIVECTVDTVTPNKGLNDHPYLVSWEGESAILKKKYDDAEAASEAKERAATEEREKENRKLAPGLTDGTIKAQSYKQVVEILKPIDGMKLAASPPLDGPSDKNQWYACPGIVVKKDGDSFICWDAGSRSGFAFTNVRQKWGEIRQNTYVGVIGRYIKNVSIRLVSGEEVLIPLLTDCYYTDGSQ